jgi:hypothetical protein
MDAAVRELHQVGKEGSGEMTRGEANNNPGNIRHVAGTVWEGQTAIQTDESFVTFTDPIYGIRAIARIMRSYERQGIDTLGEAIDRWAPPNENNSQAYVADVCARCAIAQDSIVSFDTIMPALVAAIIWHENGQMIYSDAQISQGISLAGGSS